MPLWHDPLDDLVGELERSLPQKSASRNFDSLPNLADLQYAVQEAIKGKEAWARAQEEPRMQAVIAKLTRLRQRHNAGSDRSEKG